ncbi:MAG: TIM barrel protein [bacterium]|nr:TIM barrel protein [bacterium]
MWKPKFGAVLLSHSFAPTVAEHGPLVRALATAGFGEIQFPVAGMTDADLDGFRELCEQLSLTASAVTAFVDMDESGACPISNDPQKRVRADEQMIKAMKNTKHIGAPVLCGPFLCGLGKPMAERTYITAMQHKCRVAFLRRTDGWAHEIGVELAVEGVNRFETFQGPNGTEQVVKILDDAGVTGRIGVLADVVHEAFGRRNTGDTWRKIAPRIKVIHMSDMDRTDLGPGPAFPPSVIGAIKYDLQPTCALNLELWGADYPRGIEGLLALAKPHERYGLTLFKEGKAFLEGLFQRT